MKKTKTFFFFGFGQVAREFVNKLNSYKVPFKFSATSRKKTHDINIQNVRYKKFQFNEKNFDNELIKNLEASDHILVSIPPINGKDVVIKNFSEILKRKKTKWITYLSATSVYGNHQGKWVDETSETKPTSINGIERLKAEKAWIELSKKHDLPFQIFRLSGIYSNHYNILNRLKTGDAKIVDKNSHFFSRVHIEDIAEILCVSLNNFKKNEIYNISDDQPASAIEVAMYGAKLLGINKFKKIKINEIEGEMLKNFYKDSKKVDNKKMKEFFNYKLRYSTYVNGLNHIFNNKI